ncbi:MAG: hypothetical protein CSA53_01385 [Gammaproteobacteria bacterium]|nr:MAG: hypothetical protein CSA53_01385 [Gammaproteobacteria bacterium]
MNIYNALRTKGLRFLPRRFHCYCIGAAKTATTSISSMFEENYATQHEPDIQNTNHAIIQYLEGKTTSAQICNFLKARDKKLSLELESTHSMAYVAKELAELFPQAKFIVTVRDPYKWIRSRINFHHRVKPPEWEEYRQYFWMRKANRYPEQEALLQERELAPLDVYLRQYQEHYDLLEQHLPRERCLYLKTEHVSQSLDQMTDFLGIKRGSLIDRVSNSQASKESFISDIDDDYLKAKVWQNCERFIRSYYPELINDNNMQGE